MRILPWTLSVALLLAVSSAFAGEGDSVVVETNRSLYESGESVQATVTNKRAATIFVGGCGAIVSERLEDESYVPVRGEPCVTEGKAVKIEAGQSRTFDVKDAGKSGDVRRFSIAFGWGCADGRALSQARCTEFATAVSPSYRVGKRGEQSEK